MTAPVVDLGHRVDSAPPASRGSSTDSQSGAEFEDVLRSSTSRGRSKSDGSADDSSDQAKSDIARPGRSDANKQVDDDPAKDTGADTIDADHAKHAVVWAAIEPYATAAHQKSGSAVAGAAGSGADAIKKNHALGMTPAVASSDAESDSETVTAGKSRGATAPAAALSTTLRAATDAESATAASDKTGSEKARAAASSDTKAGVPDADGEKTRAVTNTALSQAARSGAEPDRASTTAGSFDVDLAERQAGAASRSATAGDTKAGAAKAGAATATASATSTATITPAADASTAAAAGAANSVAPTNAAAATALAAPISAAPAPSAMMQPEISAALAQLRTQADGNYRLRVSVHPAELGAVDITATIRGGTLTVLLHADPTAHQAVSQALAQLREQLADSGFTGVDVSLGDPQAEGDNDTETSQTGLRHGKNDGTDAELAGDDPTRGPHLTGPARGYDRFL